MKLCWARLIFRTHFFSQKLKTSTAACKSRWKKVSNFQSQRKCFAQFIQYCFVVLHRLMNKNYFRICIKSNWQPFLDLTASEKIKQVRSYISSFYLFFNFLWNTLNSTIHSQKIYSKDFEEFKYFGRNFCKITCKIGIEFYVHPDP